MEPQQVLIVGAGRIGRALEKLITNGTAAAVVRLWDMKPGLVPDQRPLAELVAACDLLFCCTPSWTIRQLLTDVRPHLRSATPIVILSKGCEDGSGKTMAEVADEVLDHHPWALLGGPMMAEVLNDGQAGTGVVGSRHPEIQPMLASLFRQTHLHILGVPHPNAIALCGCLKNIYAFAVGLSCGLGWSDAERQRFFILAEQEFLRSGQLLGIPPEIINGPGGHGDFHTTATNPNSNNYRAGLGLAQTQQLNMHSESVVTLPSIIKRLPSLETLPILRQLSDIMTLRRPAHDLHSLVTSTH